MPRTSLRPMPPLECLIFLEAAARNGSFKSAAVELCVTISAAGGMGVAMGRASMIAQELEQGTLVPLFEQWVAAPARYLLVTTPSSRRKPAVQEFSNWILGQAGDASRAV